MGGNASIGLVVIIGNQQAMLGIRISMVGVVVLFLLASSCCAFIRSHPSRKHLLSNSRLFGDQGGGLSESRVEVALLLPSNPEDPILQDSAEKIISKLPCQACAVVCYTDEADAVCPSANALIALGVESPLDVRYVATAFRLRRSSATKSEMCQFALGGKPFAPLLGSYDEANPTWERDFPWTSAARDRKLMLQMQALFEEGDIEEYVKAIILFLRSQGG